MGDKDKKLNVGKDAVVIGDIKGDVGDGSVVIGPTDNKGNVILNQSMAVGRNAHAGPGSIAIGANSGAGSEIAVIFNEIEKIIQATDNPELITSFNELCHELNSPEKDKSKIAKLWGFIEKSSALDAATNIVLKATAFIGSVIN